MECPNITVAPAIAEALAKSRRLRALGLQPEAGLELISADELSGVDSMTSNNSRKHGKSMPIRVQQAVLRTKTTPEVKSFERKTILEVN